VLSVLVWRGDTRSLISGGVEHRIAYVDEELQLGGTLGR
jgi:hypothetical protein